MENTKAVYKLTYAINTGIILFLAGISVFFGITKMTILVYMSLLMIPVYLLSYLIIKKDHLTFYIWEVYTLIITFMAICNVCAGPSCGFQLYSLSMIPVIFVIDYLAFKLKKPRVKPVLVSLCVVLIYIATTVYASIHGPVYQIGEHPALICLMANSSAVFFFLIFYTHFLVKMNMDYEIKLEVMAHSDKLTGLSNRHYFMDYISNLTEDKLNNSWVAMLDIDDFKKVNDTYGHHCGDEVLVWVSSQLRNICTDCQLCRWGGEEFIILSVDGARDARVLEELRSYIAQHRFEQSRYSLDLTVTIGASAYKPGEEIISWIQEADDLLYEGKNTGKNKVVLDKILQGKK